MSRGVRLTAWLGRVFIFKTHRNRLSSVIEAARALGVSFEYQVGHIVFQIKIDYRYRGQIVRGVRNHEHPEPTSNRKDRPERQTGDHGLLDASESLFRVMHERE